MRKDGQGAGTVSNVDPTCGSVCFKSVDFAAYADPSGSRELKCQSLDDGSHQKGLDVHLLGFPAMAVFKDKMYVAHQGVNDDHTVWYATYDGTKWSGDNVINNVYLNCSPALAVFKGKQDAEEKLYLAHQGSDSTGVPNTLWYATFDGTKWSGDTNVPFVWLNASPAIAVYNGMLYLAHQGAGSNGPLWFMTFDGNEWSTDTVIPGVTMAGSPSMAVYDEKLYVAYNNSGASDTGGPIWVVTFDGKNWSKPFSFSPRGLTTYPGSSPSLLVTASNSLVTLYSNKSGLPTEV